MLGQHDTGGNGIDADVLVAPFDRHGGGQVLQAGLGAAILAGHRAGLRAAARRDVDDGAAAGHDPCRRLAGKEGPLHVEVDDVVVLLLGHVDQRADIRHIGAAGVVHPAVDVAVGVDGLLHHCIDMVHGADVARDIDGIAARGAHLGHRLGQRLRAAARDHHVRAGLGHDARDATPDAPAAAGDHDAFAFKGKHACLLVGIPGFRGMNA